MKIIRNHLAVGFFTLFSISPSQAEVIAATTFDGRTATGNTASGLNWTTNGVADPGEMSAFQFEAGAINLFEAESDVQDRFVPGINTGNGNTSWTTTVSLTALPGATVTIEDITLDYVSISGGQVVNVPRRSDFTVTLFSPSGVELATASVSEARSGINLDPVVAPVLLTLDSPVTLSEAGTYTLVLRGGDFLDTDETGNHTGIDNLSINGTIGGGGASLAITNIGIDPTTGDLSLTWNSIPGQNYVVRFSSDLSDLTQQLGDPVPADTGETTDFDFDLGNLPEGTPPVLFFRVEIQELP